MCRSIPIGWRLAVGSPIAGLSMSMKQLETFLAKAQSNDTIRREVESCGSDTICVAKVALRHGHKFSPANLTRWQREHQ
jgi:hypothetical protein